MEPRGAARQEPMPILRRTGTLHILRTSPPSVGGQIVQLHLKMGLPFEEKTAKLITGAVALLYFLMLVSGVILLLPTMAASLFAMRVGGNVKRMWLDLHGALGLFSLPFHIAISLTAVVFCWQDQIGRVQLAVFGPVPAAVSQTPPPPVPVDAHDLLSPDALLAALARQAPGFQPSAMVYKRDKDGLFQLLVNGVNPRYAVRGPSSGAAGMNPYNGAVTSTDRLPGHQDGWQALETNFRALHFGNYGGLLVHWFYVLLALGGCALIYTGNLLWIESRRKKARATDFVLPLQTLSSRIAGAFAVGVPLGCISGIAVTIAAAKPLTGIVGNLAAWHSGIFYAVLMLSVLWAHVRGPARSGAELLRFAAMSAALIPSVSLLSAVLPFGWNHGVDGLAVDLTALAGAAALWAMARRAARRSPQRAERTACGMCRDRPGPRPAEKLAAAAVAKGKE